MTSRYDTPVSTFLDGPYRERAEAWAACQDYARRLVAMGRTPDWGVEIRHITPTSTMFGVFLQSYPPGLPNVPDLRDRPHVISLAAAREASL